MKTTLSLFAFAILIAIVALTKYGTTIWLGVATETGAYHLASGVKGYRWNGESELILDYGKLIFDWDNMSSATKPAHGSEGPSPKPGKAQAEKPHVSEQFLKRLLKRLSSYDVTMFGDCKISPTGGRIVIEGLSEKGSDLWLVNRDGGGLRRLTDNHYNSQPAWSPSGEEIAFVNDGSVSVIDAKTRNVKRLPGLQTVYHPSEGPMLHGRWDFVYEHPRWSLNGKLITAEGVDDTEGWTTAVESRSGNKLFETSPSETKFSWNHKGELVVGTVGKFVFDWNSGLFKGGKSTHSK